MTLRLVDAPGDLGEPSAAGWDTAEAVTVALAPIALDAQPTEYVRVAWADRPYGNVHEVRVATARDGDDVLVRLEWADSDVPNAEFQDAAGVFFPTDGDAPAATIGNADHPVDLWFWQANLPAPRGAVATGPGAFVPDDGVSVSAVSALAGGRWAVVLRGSAARLAAAGRLGVVVWDGSNEERAGIGSVTADWLSVDQAS